MKILKYVLTICVVTLFIIISLKTCGNRSQPKIKTTSPEVKRDYNLLDINQLREELKKYDTIKPVTTIKRQKLNPNKYVINTKLHDREITTELEIGQVGNWKIYTGVAVAGIIAGGITVWKLK